MSSEWEVIHGDCLEVLRETEDACVDAIVTDPPYELGFMGKRWDATGIAYSVELWRECLRVLKPGGHLLAFGGTRTYHRMTCAIEDTGFEVRDSLMWITGQGFPKSLSVEKESERLGYICNCKTISERDVRPVWDGNVSSPVNAGDECGEVLLSQVSESGASADGTAAVGDSIRGGESGMEGRNHFQEKQGKLYRAEVRAMSGGVPADGAQGRLRDGASASDGDASRSLSESRGGGSPQGPQHAEQRPVEPGTIREQRGAQTCRGCGKTRRESVKGLGTALKPAHEPVVLARKPLIGTVAENVQAHGTGALNIDATRIAFEGGKTTTRTNHSSSSYMTGNIGGVQPIQEEYQTGSNIGRWPANVILDESAAALLDQQSGTLISGSRKAGVRKGMGFHGANGDGGPSINGSSGGASRFYYVAKPSRTERDAGCEDIAPRTAGEATDRKDGSEGLSSPRAGAGRTGGARNSHPTVKPIALMRYLVRLITPPGGLVLDPFAGSGTTGCAAALEGVKFVGIEREEEYANLARRRIAYWSAHREEEYALDRRRVK